MNAWKALFRSSLCRKETRKELGCLVGSYAEKVVLSRSGQRLCEVCALDFPRQQESALQITAITAE